jgi:flagellar hook-length control protein FliK
VAAKSGTDTDGQAGAGSNAAKSVEQPAAAAKKVAAFVFKAPVAAEAPQSEKPLPTATSTAPSTIATSSAKPAAEPSRPSAVPFAHEAENDSSLHVSLLPQAAHLRMEVEGAGDLSLHLRMRDGFAHVTVSGAAAPLVEMRSADLRSALAGQGLSLGQLEQVTAASTTNLGDAQSQQLARDGGSQSQAHDREDPDDESRKSAPGKAARTSSAFTISRSIASASGKR